MTVEETPQTSETPAVEKPSSPPTPGAPNYDPLLDPKVSQWRDSLLVEAGRKEREIAALKDQLRQKDEQHKPVQETLAELQKKERERAGAEMTEVQRHQSRVAELEQQQREYQAQNEAAKVELTRAQEQYTKERDAWANERFLIETLGLKGIYPNEFEREGLFVKMRGIQFATEEERQQRLTALLDTFVAGRYGVNGRQSPVAPSPSIPFQVPTPPGGSPPGTPQLLEDNYTDFELTQLARTNRELYEKIANQRAAMRKARGVLPVYSR